MLPAAGVLSASCRRLVLGSVAPARLRACSCPLAAPGGHSLGEEREGERGEREEATRTDLGAGTGIFITPVISLLRARLRSFPHPPLCTLRPVRGGAGGCGGGRRWERANGRKPGGGKLHPDARRARTRATHPSSSHAPRGHLPRANAAPRFSPARAPDSSRGQPLGWGLEMPVSEFSSSRTSAERWRPSNAPSPTQYPVSKFTSPVPSRPDCHHPRPLGCLGNCIPRGFIQWGNPRPCSKCWPKPNKDSQPNLGRLWCGALGGRLWLLIY